MLSPEDSLKLNVLITTSVAIRIDRYKLEVVGLTESGQEQTIALSPSGDSDNYINEVKKLLVAKVLGAMGGYPSYLKRWSRMGQVSSSNLQSLLKLGEIEAVVAVANSEKLSDEIVSLAWWCATNTDEQAEIGRFLLSKDFVVKHPVGRQIAEYLLEFLPFTDNTEVLIDTTYLILQDGLVSDEVKERIWQQGQRKTAFLVGFIERLHGNLPNINNTVAIQSTHKELDIVSTEQAQILLKTILHILKKINQEYVLYRTLEMLGKYLKHNLITTTESIDNLNNEVEKACVTIGDNNEKIKARLFLAGVSEKLVVSYISAHNLTGSAIRKKLSNVLNPIQDAIKVLTTP